jgi:hypothetical protein
MSPNKKPETTGLAIDPATHRENAAENPHTQAEKRRYELQPPYLYSKPLGVEARQD